jgi:uncharacterized delta-60 repeat protein
VQTNFTGSDGATDVALRGNNIVVVGFSTDDDDPNYGHFALVRYNPNGSLDTSFSGDGKQTTIFGSFGVGGANGVALQSDGKIVAVGDCNFAGHDTSQIAIARYNPNGSLDRNFAGIGFQVTSVGIFAYARGVAIQADGKIVAVGAGDSEDGGFLVARYNLDGELDTSFSGDGLQMTNFGVADGVAIQADGKIVAVGGAGPFGPGQDFGLARYNPDGTLDTSFSGDGLQTTDFLFGAGDEANDVALQANGRIVAVGVAGGGATGNDFGLARYNTNGSLDTSFSADGRKRTSFGGSDSASGVALQGDGRIVAVGAGNGEFALARYLGG